MYSSTNRTTRGFRVVVDAAALKSPHARDARLKPHYVETVAGILGSVAGRFSLETTFRDVKEIIGAGQQQVRSAGSVGAFTCARGRSR